MFKKLVKQLREEKVVNSDNRVTSPIESLKNQAKINFLKNLSKHALNMYERKTDINNFTRLVLSDPENTSHNQIVDELFAGKNPLSDEALFDLSENKRFLDDLGL